GLDQLGSAEELARFGDELIQRLLVASAPPGGGLIENASVGRRSYRRHNPRAEPENRASGPQSSTTPQLTSSRPKWPGLAHPLRCHRAGGRQDWPGLLSGRRLALAGPDVG